MLILGISSSAVFPSAALSQDGRILGLRKDESGRSHSASLMELIEGVLSDAGRNVSELDAVAVDVGPGSFTGVRIGVSCANALAEALGISVIPVCSLAALAEKNGGTACTLIDCRNGNCYAAVYEDGAEKLSPCAAVTEDIVGSLPEGTATVGDCLGGKDRPDAALVLAAASRRPSFQREAVPMYLRPSQAERMRSAR